MSRNNANSEKYIEANTDGTQSNSKDKIASYRTLSFTPKHKQNYTSLSNTNRKENELVAKDTINKNLESINLKKDIDSSPRSLKINQGEYDKSNNISAQPSMTISLPDSKTLNNQNEIFMPPQIILSFQDDGLDNDENLDETNNKILYTSNEGYRIGEEKIINNFEDLNKIINFGDEKEPETDEFLIIRAKNHSDIIKNDEELEEMKKISIKYADSEDALNKFDFGIKKETISKNEESKTEKDIVNQNQKSDYKLNNKKKSIIDEKTKSVISVTEVEEDDDSPKPEKKASLQTPSLMQMSNNNKRGRRYSTMPFVPVKNNKITGDHIDTNNEIIPTEFLNNKSNIHSDVASQYNSKFSTSLKEFIPQRGLLYSEFQQFNSSWILCKPKLLPLKSIEIQKIEKMEKAVYKARQNTGIRLTRTASYHTVQQQNIRTNEIHTSPEIISGKKPDIAV
ncbi:hypothetical protein BCR36DRAFT_416152 [Piromyces finnis]|uniref:Uncharacterized protein n=1 Tax=Piromyces finnis TaxID=1754191 RepID=A0A1Y1UYN2_9FUNG|nr:hypothetical protein BCR36DRAFT_416152 [Piromyces finnis]|eukprot:ORX42408.1 hypothetical protein BCR36DRAFT_416152 [Piromyces finnis]